MAGYVFVSNSSKPSEEEQYSREPLPMTNVERPCLKAAMDMGYNVYYGVNRDDPDGLECELPVHAYDSHTYRSITALGDNRIAYRNLCRVIDRGLVEVIHCNTPIGGLVGRLAGRKKKKQVKKVIYTAHGFHFYKGASKKSWLMFYPVEKLCARLTDELITINKEDYKLAESKLRAGRVKYIPGVGIDTEKFIAKADREEIRKRIGVPAGVPLLLSVGELNENKNHKAAVRALAALAHTDAHYAIAGRGALDGYLLELSRKLGVEGRVHLLGYREDVAELYTAADVFVHPSHREGLPVAVIEAMASGLAVVASRIRGNTDLIDEDGGILLCPCNSDGFADAIDKILSDGELREKMGAHNREAARKYSTEAVTGMLLEIYKQS